ncbi:MAG: PfkB family carbohydrate kinase [Hyphomicrobiales bacterium]
MTHLHPGYDRSALAGIDVIACGTNPAPRYANRYDPSGKRTQLILAEGSPLDADWAAVPAMDAHLVAPAYHELAAIPPVRARVTAVALQGPLRAAADGRVIPHPDPIAQVAPFIAPGVLAFLSDEDTAEPTEVARYLAAAGMTVLLTLGYRGALMFEAGRQTAFEALPANPIEPTGAGDCFATAFVVRYAETGDLHEACQFALAAGALAVEGAGMAGVPSRAAIEARLRKVAA